MSMPFWYSKEYYSNIHKTANVADKRRVSMWPTATVDSSLTPTHSHSHRFSCCGCWLHRSVLVGHMVYCWDVTADKLLLTHSLVFELNEYNATWLAVSTMSVIYGSRCCSADKFILPSALLAILVFGVGKRWCRLRCARRPLSACYGVPFGH